MNTTPNALAHLGEHELLEHFEALVTRDRCNTAHLLVAIGEIDQRKLWARHACQSMFEFCVERFHMSEQVTAKRIWAARTARRFPVILEMVERGELHLSAIHLLARHLTAHNCNDVLRRARHKSSREIERLVADLAPRPDVVSSVRALPRTVVGTAPAGSGAGAGTNAAAGARSNAAAADSGASVAAASSAAAAVSSASATPAEPAPALASYSPGPTAIQPYSDEAHGGSPVSRPAARPITALSPRRYKIEITVDEETHDKLRSLQDLVGHSTVGRDPAAIISRAIDVLLVDTLKRKAAMTDRLRRLATHPKRIPDQGSAAYPRRCGGPCGGVTVGAAATWTAADAVATRPGTSSFTTRIRSRWVGATTRTTSSCAARLTISTRPISTSAATSWTPGAEVVRRRCIPRGMSGEAA